MGKVSSSVTSSTILWCPTRCLARVDNGLFCFFLACRIFGYFYLQDAEYISLKQRFAEHIARGKIVVHQRVALVWMKLLKVSSSVTSSTILWCPTSVSSCSSTHDAC